MRKWLCSIVYLDLAQSACLPDKVDQIYMDKSIMTTTGANSNVLAFYKELPFNYQETAILHADRIKSTNAVDNYPVLKNLLKSRGIRVFEIGCGSGWLSNAMSYHHGADVMARPVGRRRDRTPRGRLPGVAGLVSKGSCPHGRDAIHETGVSALDRRQGSVH